MKSKSTVNNKKAQTCKKSTTIKIPNTIDCKAEERSRKNVSLCQPLHHQLPIQKLHRNRTAFTEEQLQALENG